jgi:hypothetical protein
MTEYLDRGSIFEPERRFSLKDDGLAVEGGGQGMLVPYDRIAGVQMLSGPRRRRCVIRLKGGREFALSERFAESLLRGRRQGPAYRAFVLDLHSRLAPIPGIRFRRGLHPQRYLGIWLILAGTGLLIAANMLIFPSRSPALLALRALLLLCLYQAARNHRRHGKPGTYPPDAVPEGLLP